MPTVAAPAMSSVDDPAVLLMSGGTTGTPKGVLGTHGAYVLRGMQIKAWTASVLGGERDVICAAAAAVSRLRERRRPEPGVRQRRIRSRSCRIRATWPICSPRSAASSRRSSTACRRSTSRC